MTWMRCRTVSDASLEALNGRQPRLATRKTERDLSYSGTVIDNFQQSRAGLYVCMLGGNSLHHFLKQCSTCHVNKRNIFVLQLSCVEMGLCRFGRMMLLLN